MELGQRTQIQFSTSFKNLFAERGISESEAAKNGGFFFIGQTGYITRIYDDGVEVALDNDNRPDGSPDLRFFFNSDNNQIVVALDEVGISEDRANEIWQTHEASVQRAIDEHNTEIQAKLDKAQADYDHLKAIGWGNLDDEGRSRYSSILVQIGNLKNTFVKRQPLAGFPR